MTRKANQSSLFSPQEIRLVSAPLKMRVLTFPVRTKPVLTDAEQARLLQWRDGDWVEIT